jgi:predicted ester cyclase
MHTNADVRAEQTMRDLDVEPFLRESVEAIWNRKMLGRIQDLYAPHALIHIGAGDLLHGGQQLLDRAVQCLAAFPDLRVFIDDLIYARRDAAYLTSVCWTAVARNTGPSLFGAATGRRVVVTGITASRIEGGRFVEQWIELGDGDLVRQLGFDERSVLRRLWPEEAASDFDAILNQGATGMPPGSARGSRPLENNAYGDVGSLVGASVDAIWNQRQVGEVERFFAPRYRERGPGSRALFGHEEVRTDIVSLMGAFPDLRMHIDDVFWNDNERGGCRSATRWTLLGSNTGASAYGSPTNAYLRLSGITNHLIEGGQFVEGRTAYSELGLARRLVHGDPRAQSAETE